MTETLTYVAVTKYGAPIEAFDTRARALAWFRQYADEWPECEVIERRVLSSERRIVRHKLAKDECVVAFPKLRVVGGAS